MLARAGFRRALHEMDDDKTPVEPVTLEKVTEEEVHRLRRRVRALEAEAAVAASVIRDLKAHHVAALDEVRARYSAEVKKLELANQTLRSELRRKR